MLFENHSKKARLKSGGMLVRRAMGGVRIVVMKRGKVRSIIVMTRFEINAGHFVQVVIKLKAEVLLTICMIVFTTLIA